MMPIESDLECPFCGETISILVDPSEAYQTYIEDCSVCCRPIQVNVACDEGELTMLEAARS